MFTLLAQELWTTDSRFSSPEWGMLPGRGGRIGQWMLTEEAKNRRRERDLARDNRKSQTGFYIPTKCKVKNDPIWLVFNYTAG